MWVCGRNVRVLEEFRVAATGRVCADIIVAKVVTKNGFRHCKNNRKAASDS